MTDNGSSFAITGGIPLRGRVAAGGSKNATLPVLAATLLSSETVMLANVPDILDVSTSIAILRAVGSSVSETSAGFQFQPKQFLLSKVPEDLGAKIRGSYYFFGALLGRTGRAEIPTPGGCDIGTRPMNLHISTLQALGCNITETAEGLFGVAPPMGAKIAKRIVLPFPSRGATINLLLFAALRPNSEVHIANANQSPECLCLQNFLMHLGAEIIGAGSKNLLIRGQTILRPRSDIFPIPADKIEVATLLLAGLITGGSTIISNAEMVSMKPFLKVLEAIGVKAAITDDGLQVTSQLGAFVSTDVVASIEENGLDADFEPLLAALLCNCFGKAIIEDKLNPERHARFLPQLTLAGADITVLSPTRASIRGPTDFKPFVGYAADIRGGAAQILAALKARGQSIIHNAHQVDRGYQTLDLKLQGLGASLRRAIYHQK
jgi:UDP-N-acetylglucosamine 1-carboxyvinyltransferase